MVEKGDGEHHDLVAALDPAGDGPHRKLATASPKVAATNSSPVGALGSHRRAIGLGNLGKKPRSQMMVRTHVRTLLSAVNGQKQSAASFRTTGSLIKAPR